MGCSHLRLRLAKRLEWIRLKSIQCSTFAVSRKPAQDLGTGYDGISHALLCNRTGSIDNQLRTEPVVLRLASSSVLLELQELPRIRPERPVRRMEKRVVHTLKHKGNRRKPDPLPILY